MNYSLDASAHPLYAVMAFSCALMVAILIVHSRLTATDRKSIIHTPLFYWVVAFCVQDGIWGLFAAKIIENATGLYVTSYIFHIFSALTPVVWIIYMLTRLRRRMKHHRLYVILATILSAVQLVMLFNNLFSGFMFSVNTHGVYESTKYRWILFMLQFMVFIAIAFVSLVFYIKSEIREQRREYEIIFIVNAAPVFFGIFQMLYSDAPASSIGLTIGCVLIHSFLTTDYEKQISDLKEKEKLQFALEEALIMAKKANDAKTQFLFNMSHDIRTPMNAILGYTERGLRHVSRPEVMKDSLYKVKNSGEYLLDIINNVLDMARIESGKIDIMEEVSYFPKESEKMRQVMYASASAKNITIHYNAHAITDEYIVIDTNHCNEIFMNILSNAIKYTNPGGEIWHFVEQLPSEREGYVKIKTVVRDNGIGMSEDFLPKIYEAFEREKNTTLSRVQGTGLGMSIVKHLVDVLGGTISVESKLGEGSIVTVVLEHRIATAEEIEEYNSKRIETTAALTRNMEGMKILLVEDNEMNLEIAKDILEEMGIEVSTANDGDVAVKMMAKSNPGDFDLILMDIQMPKMNGYEATMAIRKLPNSELSNIPIIAMTANAFDEDRRNAIQAGMNEHLSKPIDIAKLVDVIGRYAKDIKSE